MKLSVASIISIVGGSEFIGIFLRKHKLQDFDGELLTNVNTSDIYTDESSDVHNFNSSSTLNPIKKISEDKKESLETSRFNFIRQIGIRNLVVSQQNSGGLDWIVLDNRLRSEWQSFIIFGFQVDDVTMGKKIVAIITGILMLFQINNTYI